MTFSNQCSFHLQAKSDRVDSGEWLGTSTENDVSTGEASSAFMGSITRGSPRRREGPPSAIRGKQGPPRTRVPLNLPEGQQPSIEDIYTHAGLISWPDTYLRILVGVGILHFYSWVKNGRYVDCLSTWVIGPCKPNLVCLIWVGEMDATHMCDCRMCFVLCYPEHGRLMFKYRHCVS